ncbi:hypothetical protein A2U01_0050652, partial [Trifolium medium]|nr:hypothetical protein [Trifolium medium]
MLVIMETRCDPNKLRRSFSLLGYDEFSATEVQGYAGVKYPNEGWWYFTPVYASPNEAMRNVLWNELKSIALTMQEP